MMKKNNLTNWFFITGLAFFLTTGCAPPLDVNPCFEVVCENDGTCFDGVCFCPAGFIGLNCELFDPTQVQALLNEGITPIELINANIPLENLYGMQFEDGLIFYLNTDDGTGMIAAAEDQDESEFWGCSGDDISELSNVANLPAEIDLEVGARIDDGLANTDAIISECNGRFVAARLCRELGDAWFLPSRAELNLMYINLSSIEKAGFSGNFYWSSTEIDSDFVWSQDFNNGRLINGLKSNGISVRAARSF